MVEKVSGADEELRLDKPKGLRARNSEAEHLTIAGTRLISPLLSAERSEACSGTENAAQ